VPTKASRASKNGGPTRTPTFPGSVVPLAKMMVHSVQAPAPSSFWVVCTPVKSAMSCSKSVKTPMTAARVSSMTGRFSNRIAKNSWS